MKIEVFPVKATKSFPDKAGNHWNKSVVDSWSWRTKVNGRITASAHGYNRKSDAVRAAVNHGYAFFKMLEAEFELPLDEKADKELIRAAIKVIE